MMENFQIEEIPDQDQAADGLHAPAPIKRITLEAIVIRADGTTEDLGQIAYWHKSRFKRIWHRLCNPQTGTIRSYL